ncbi:MAG TPA: prolyl oligopeptidase family serine peptidase, partial [Steroidobacteraceae bacterium]|nr:prolyl oligopeptidase family serine peptidase [Steroidobacteraceae bacterium]
MSLRVVLSLVSGLTAGTVFAAPTLESFATAEEIKDAVLSPDGRYLAVISTHEAKRIVFVRDLQGGDQMVPAMTSNMDADIDIKWCRFANATRLLCGFGGSVKFRTLMTPSSALAAVDVDGKNLSQLMSSDTRRFTAADERIFDRMGSDPNKVLVRTGTGGLTDSPLQTYLFEVDVATGKSTQVKQTLDNRELWTLYTDGVGNFRLADGYGLHKRDYYSDGTGTSFTMELRSSDPQALFATVDGKEWRKLEKASAFSKTNPLARLAVNPATGRAYGFADYQGRKALWEFDLDDKEAPRVGFAHPKVDVGDVVTDGAGRVIGVTYETDRPAVQYIDEKLIAIVRGVNKGLPDTFNSIRSMSADGKKLVIAARSDVEAGRFFLFDVTSGKLSPIGAVYPQLDAKQLARMRPVEYAAKDGAKIPAYLTTPADGRTEKLPLIVMPHEGSDRSSWEFDALTQFLAARGYAVLAMNYRGSSGYGKEWRNAGKDDWSGVVYSDMTDAARWAVAEGIADPQRVCAIGRGFGAYAALLGATRDADLYKCVASIGGFSDLSAYVNTMRG